MDEQLYLKIDRNILVSDPRVRLGDIAKLECTNESVLRQLKQKKIYTFHGNEKKKSEMAVFSVLKIIQKIHEDYPDLDVENIGESDFLIEWKKDFSEHKVLEFCKEAVLCVLIFFGSAFTIMAFNNDVAAGEVFDRLYYQVTGIQAPAVTELEVCYALGMPLGIMIFYNHIGKKKVTHDPTPIQVEMRKYEQDVDTTFVENVNREGKSIDVD